MPQRELPSKEFSLPASSALRDALERTPARVFTGRAGTAYPTAAQLKLQEDHAFALDAVRAELDLLADFDQEFLREHGLFEVPSGARSKAEHLRRPDLGRKLGPGAAAMLRERCPASADVQVVLGDGLSPAALRAQAPGLLPRLRTLVQAAGWSWGQPFVVRYARVGLLNELGPLLAASAYVLLIGERPGLQTAESLSAYLAFRPRLGQTDADRNLISNIHAQGVGWDEAASRVVGLIRQMFAQQTSGVSIKEQLTAAGIGSATLLGSGGDPATQG